MIKLNLGCGNNQLDGYLNVDNQPNFQPDLVVDLEHIPWPFESNSVSEVVISHVLEHLGETTEIYLGIIKELYRVCANAAKVFISVPHPRHDEFLIDPTHIRPILPDQFYMFSKKSNREWTSMGLANSQFADYLEVDFDVVNTKWIPADKWLAKLKSGEVNSEDLVELATHQFNIIKQIDIELVVIK
ncbi:MAG: hypothetical protein VX617_07945 [Pseudomonadota bacterium]|nr:hypothetical protein [Pseudomonadota bacterium]